MDHPVVHSDHRRGRRWPGRTILFPHGQVAQASIAQLRRASMLGFALHRGRGFESYWGHARKDPPKERRDE